MGQVSANFYLKPWKPDPRARKKKGWKDVEHLKTEGEFKKATEFRARVNIDFAIFGIRGLIRAAKRPKITITLTNDPESR